MLYFHITYCTEYIRLDTASRLAVVVAARLCFTPSSFPWNLWNIDSTVDIYISVFGDTVHVVLEVHLGSESSGERQHATHRAPCWTSDAVWEMSRKVLLDTPSGNFDGLSNVICIATSGEIFLTCSGISRCISRIHHGAMKGRSLLSKLFRVETWQRYPHYHQFQLQNMKVLRSPDIRDRRRTLTPIDSFRAGEIKKEKKRGFHHMTTSVWAEYLEMEKKKSQINVKTSYYVRTFVDNGVFDILSRDLIRRYKKLPEIYVWSMKLKKMVNL